MPTMPTVIVLFVCKSFSVPFATEIEEHNAAYTGMENREWDTKHSTMHCRRHELQVYDSAEAMGASSQPFTPHRCRASSIMVGTLWDQQHKGGKYRVWKTACPTPIIDTRTGKIIAWKKPECPRINHKDRVPVTCDVDITT